jgi:signal transduction histidine kinase
MKAHSIKRQLVLLFALLALALTFVFGLVAQHSWGAWRELSAPVIADYVDRLVHEMTGASGRADAQSIERARQVALRLPVLVRIDGPLVQWRSDVQAHNDGRPWPAMSIARTISDGHTISLGLDQALLSSRGRPVVWGLLALLALTALAYWLVRRMLKPLDAIAQSAQRLGTGDFESQVAVRNPQRPDELDQLATTFNTMSQDIRGMMDAKRGLLLAISHELRSPLTRARLNVELIPSTPDAEPIRLALLRDINEMASLITDLLESERLEGRHVALMRERVDLNALCADVMDELADTGGMQRLVSLATDADCRDVQLDRTRMRLLVRNLVGNALKHGASDRRPMVEVALHRSDNQSIEIAIRDYGPGVSVEWLPRLAKPFARPDSARSRANGGVGLGLHLCRLIALAHGGTMQLSDASPGFLVRVVLKESFDGSPMH